MKKLTFLLLSILIFSCSTEPIVVSENNETTQLNSLLSKGKPGSDPADNNKQKIMFTSTVDGTFEEKLASLQIVSAHAKPVSINWDLSGTGDIKSEENLIVSHIVIYEKGFPTQWEKQMSTSGWRGIWFADTLDKGKTYILWFKTYGIEVEFVMPSGKI